MDEKQIIIKSRLQNDWDFCSLCLLKLYEQQTDDEQDIGDTQHENGKGFTKADANFLSPFSRYMQQPGADPNIASKKETVKRLRKYVRQLTTLLTDEEIEL